MRPVGSRPRYVITDNGGKFSCGAFEASSSRRRIRPRFGSVGKHGSIAVLERFMRSKKNQCCRRIMVPMRVAKLRAEVSLYLVCRNHHRPHQRLGGRTPDEEYFHWVPANERRRCEPRRNWPAGSVRAESWAKVTVRRAVKLDIRIGYLDSPQHLFVVAFQRAA